MLIALGSSLAIIAQTQAVRLLVAAFAPECGDVGIGTATPGSTLEVNQGTSGNSGLKFSQLNSSSTPATNAGSLGVDASGNVVLKRSISAGSFTQASNNNSAGSNSHRFTLTAPSAGTYLFNGAASIWTNNGTALQYQVKWNGTYVYTVGTGSTSLTSAWQKIPFTYTQAVASGGTYTLDLVLSYGSGMESAELSYLFIPPLGVRHFCQLSNTICTPQNMTKKNIGSSVAYRQCLTPYTKPVVT